MTLRRSGYNLEPFSSATPRCETRLLLARLVEAEIVSPYCGLFINAGVGNPTAPFARPLGIGEFKASGKALDIHGLYKGLRIPFLYPHVGSSVPELQCPSFSLPSF